MAISLTLASACGRIGFELSSSSGDAHDAPGVSCATVEFVAKPSPSVGTGVEDVVAADVNGDGKVDLLVTDRLASAVGILDGNGDGTFQPERMIASGVIAVRLVVEDVSGDGRPDLVVAGRNSLVTVLLGNGDGTFNPTTNYVTATDPTAVKIADVTGDGKLDINVLCGQSNALSVFAGNGNGTFQPRADRPMGSYPASLAIADLSGDGTLDAIVANNVLGGMEVSRGIGGGAFATSVRYSLPNGISSAVALGDFDRDGRIDAAITVRLGGNTASTIAEFAGNGDGTFGPQQDYAAGPDPFDVVAGDVTGDGILDLVVANFQTSASISVLPGNGDGTFQAPLQLATGPQPGAVAIADVDADLLPDLLAVNYGDGTITVLTASCLAN